MKHRVTDSTARSRQTFASYIDEHAGGARLMRKWGRSQSAVPPVVSRRMRTSRQFGQGSVEYLGVVMVVGVLLVALIAVLPSIGDSVTCKISQAIASVTGDSAECSGGTAEAQGAESDDGDEDSAVPNPSPQPTGATQRQPSPKPGPSPLPTYPGLPYGLVPDSDLVRTMQLTERGRQTLQWLADNKVQVYIDDDAGGAFWNGRYITMGHGPGEALTLIHEANHARYSKEGRGADARKLSRQDYIDAGIAEEVDGGSNDATARQAGRDAVRQAFENGAFVGVGSGKTYYDSLGASWDSQHSCYFLFIRWKC